MKWIFLLALLHAGAGAADEVTALHGLERTHCCLEADPIIRAIAGQHPGPVSLTLIGALGVTGTAGLAYAMRHSSHKWVRRAWWVPQVAAAGIHFGYALHNHRLTDDFRTR